MKIKTRGQLGTGTLVPSSKVRLKRADRLQIETLEQRALLSASALDTSFGAAKTGKVTALVESTSAANYVLPLSTGSYLVAGTDGTNAIVERYTSAGVLDTSFAGTGKGIAKVRFTAPATAVADQFEAMALQSDGKLVAVGSGAGGFAIARFNADGSLDTSFGSAKTGKVTTTFLSNANGFATSLSVAPITGKIVVAGVAKGTSYTDMALARFNTNGTLDTTFGSAKTGKLTFDYAGFDDNATGVAVFKNGKIVMSGTVTNKSGTKAGDTDFGVIRYNDNGMLDTTFSPGGTDGSGITTADFTANTATGKTNDYAYAMAITCGNRITVAGGANVAAANAATPNYNFAMVRFKYDGSLDSSFGNLVTGRTRSGKVTTELGSTSDFALGMAFTPMNKIVLAGQGLGSVTNPNYDFALAQYNADGTPDLTFNPSNTAGVKSSVVTNFTTTAKVGSDDEANSVAVASNGKIIAVGSSVASGSTVSDIAMARYTGTAPTGDGNEHLCQGTKIKAGTSISGSIASGTDVDFYSIDVTAGQTISFDLNQSTGSSLDSYVRLFDEEGNQLYSNDNGASANETLGTSSYFSYTFSVAGTYYIGVSGAGNSSYDPVTEDYLVNSSSTGSYSVVFTDLTPTSDTGNSKTSSKSVTVGSTVYESISTTTDIDIYSLTVTAGETIQFNVDLPGGSGLDSYLRLFNSSGTMIASNNDGAAVGENFGKASYLSYTFSVAGTYYIGISGNGNISYNVATGSGTTTGSTGTYSLTISRTVSDIGNTISTSRSVSIGTSVSDSIGISTDVDVYSFTATAGQTYSFDINLTSGSLLDSYLRLFNSAGTQIAFNNDGAGPGEALGKASYLSYTFATTGTYYLGLSGNGNTAYNITSGTGTTAGSTGGYTLTTANITPTGDPDDQISEAHFIASGSVATDSISNSTDVDMYDVSVAANVTLTFTVADNASSLTPLLRVFNSAGTQLATAGSGNGASLSFTFTTAGNYYIAVSGSANKSYNAVTGNGDVAGSTGGYTFTVTVPSSTDPDDTVATARTTTLNSTVSDSISNSTDVDAYKFTATAGTLIGIDVDVPTSSQLNSYIELVLPSGQYLKYNSGSAAPDEAVNGKDAYLEYMIQTSGTYYVFVSSSENENYNTLTGKGDVPGSSGAYSITLTNLTTQDGDDTIDSAHAISIGSTTTGSITFSNDVNVYKFTASAGQTVGFDIDVPSGSGLSSYIEVANSAGQYITYNQSAAAPDEVYHPNQSYLEYTFITSGTYYVAVAGATNENFDLVTGGSDYAGAGGTTGAYTLIVTDIGTQDPNDQLTEAAGISTNSTINDNISNANDVDLFKFTVSAGQKMSFNINLPGGGSLYSYLEILNSAGNYVTYNSGSAAPGETYDGKQSYLEYTFTTAGTYYVAVSTAANENYNAITGGRDAAGAVVQSGNYTLIVRTI